MFYLSKDEITFEAVEIFCKKWPEGVRVEYKREIQPRKHIPKIVSAFANTQGGVFIIGVEADQTDNKVKVPIVGIPDTPIEESITESALDGIHPSVMPEVIKVPVPDSDNVVVVVRVAESVNAPHAIQNKTKVYIRAGSVTPPYELAEIDRIEYFFKRRQDAQIVTQQILDRIESRAERFCNMNAPALKVIARPVFAYRPVISPTAIFALHRRHAPMSRKVPGGVCYAGKNRYQETNEYGIVYFAKNLSKEEEKTLKEDDDSIVSVYRCSQFIGEIADLLEEAKSLYGVCEAVVNIEVVAELVNVFGNNMSSNIGGHPFAALHPRDLVCNTPEVYASTSTPYLSRDLNDATRQISEELTMQLLWAFNMPTEIGAVKKAVKDLIEKSIR